MATNKTEINSKLLISVVVIFFLSLGLNIFFFASRKNPKEIQAKVDNNIAIIDSLEDVIATQKLDTVLLKDTIEVPKLKIVYETIEKKYPNPTIIDRDSLIRLWSELGKR